MAIRVQATKHNVNSTPKHLFLFPAESIKYRSNVIVTQQVTMRVRLKNYRFNVNITQLLHFFNVIIVVIFNKQYITGTGRIGKKLMNYRRFAIKYDSE